MVKPTVLFLLVLGMSGYIFLDGLSKHHFKLKRTNGYHTFFKSTSYGLGLFFFASILHFFFIKIGSCLGIKFNFGYWVLTNSIALKPSSEDAALLNISLISLVLAIVIPKLILIFFHIGGREFYHKIIKS